MPYRMLDLCDDSSDWTVLSDSTTNLTTDTGRVTGDACLEFDKASAGETYAGVDKTLDAGQELDLKGAKLSDVIAWVVLFPTNVTNLAYSFVRLGTDSSNYAEWRYADTSHTADRFTFCSAKIGDQYVTGKGVDYDDIPYIAVGAVFDSAGNTKTDILFDCVMYHKTILTTT